MTQSSSSPDLSRRQVLVNLGNRWVVFGSKVTLPGGQRFTPHDGISTLPRVADESDHAEERILKSLRVSDSEVIRAERPYEPDLEIVDREGNRTLVEVKVREREPSSRDFEQIKRYLRPNRNDGTPQRFEVWNFNIERLKLHIFSKGERGLAQHLELVPLDVWDYGLEGVPFDRSRVLERVNDWERRIYELYALIEEWTGRISGVRAERARSVEMSEELMQKFAVPDRELLILDILREDKALASFVPRGLWLIGYNGRIDIITADGTRLLVDAGEKGTVDWKLVDTADRSFLAFDESTFKNLLGVA